MKANSKTKYKIMINKVTLIGNLGRDPEIRHLENGSVVGRFSLATNENYKDKSGAWQTQTEWHDVVVWRMLAERAERELKKGSLCYVEGKLTHRKYTDKDGVERYITEVVANNVKLLEKREFSGEKPYDNFPTIEKTGGMTSNSNYSSQVQESSGDSFQSADDDLPF